MADGLAESTRRESRRPFDRDGLM